MSKIRKREALLHQLADLHGIGHEYTDGNGVRRSVAPKALRHILGSMGVRCDTLLGMRRAVADAKARPWTAMIDEVVVVRPTYNIPVLFVSLPLQSYSLDHVSFKLTLRDEEKRLRQLRRKGSSCKRVGSRTIHGIRYVRIQLLLPRRIPYGYYLLSVFATFGSCSLEGQTFLISAPAQCYLPANPRRSWGITIQLYGLRSRTNWGVGDFRDLKTVMKWAGGTLGAATIGINPIHPLPSGIVSPYSPSSRLFYDPLYLDVEAVAEYGSTASIQRRVRSRSFQEKLNELRLSWRVQYEDVRTVKLEILEALFKAFVRQHERRVTARARVFHKFIADGGLSLDRFAVFQALNEHHHPSTWREWPYEFQDPNSREIERFKKHHLGRIRFFQYLQWQCDLQLKRLDQIARDKKMSFGLYHDLPVGIHPDGADAWVFHEQMAQAVTVGAPPDSFNPKGQNWGLMPPFSSRMRASGYRLFIETVRQNMRYGGLLRIDHALGLFRFFWVPEGCSGEEGAYVQTPVDEVLAILALESVKNKVMVIGEDLGTVTPTIRRGLAQAGLLSYRLLLFEKTPQGTFRSPSFYPQQALVAATTHDLPTLRGFWEGRDIEVKEQAGLYLSRKQSRHDRNLRVGERLALFKSLQREGLLRSVLTKGIPERLGDEHCAAIYGFLTRTACRVLVVTLEDLLGERETPNLPGASNDAYPSWRLKIGKSLESWTNDPIFQQIVSMIRQYR